VIRRCAIAIAAVMIILLAMADAQRRDFPESATSEVTTCVTSNC
jgi:hypothetical protein